MVLVFMRELDTTVCGHRSYLKNTIILIVFPPRFCLTIVSNFSWKLLSHQDRLMYLLEGKK